MSAPSSAKTNPGNYFEDFRLDQEIIHATPRTVTAGDVSLYTALYGTRFAVNSSAAFATAIGFPTAPVDDLLAFHLVFGKTVPDISLNAVANLGYAGGRFGVPLYPGDTVRTVSRVIGLRENANKQTGVVHVRSTGTNQKGEMVVDYVRWVMVRKRDPNAPTPAPHSPTLPGAVAAGDLMVPAGLDLAKYELAVAGSAQLWDDYAAGEKIDHVDGMTIEELEHQLATRLYQNTAKVHFNLHTEREGRFKRRIVYGGHVISLARSLSSTAWPTPSRWQRSTPGPTPTPPSPATPSMPGRRCWTRSSCRDVAIWGHCASGRLRPRTAPASTSPTRAPTASTTRRSCSISTTPFCCRAAGIRRPSHYSFRPLRPSRACGRVVGPCRAMPVGYGVWSAFSCLI